MSEKTTRNALILPWPVIVIIVAGGLLLLGWYGQRPDPDQTALTREQALLVLDDLQSDLERAVTHGGQVTRIQSGLEGLLASHPDLVAAHNALAQAQLHAEQPEQAYASLRRSLSVDPEQPEIWLMAGTLARGAQRHDDAVAHYQQAVQRGPQVPRYAEHLAVALMTVDQHDEADEVLASILVIHPTRHTTWSQRAELARQQEQPEQAVDFMQQALLHAPATDTQSLQRYHVRLCLWHIDRQDFVAAAENLERLRQISPNHPELEHLQDRLSAQADGS